MASESIALVVEDNAAVREALVKTITQFGMKVYSTGDPVDALDKATQLNPDVVVLDWELDDRLTGIDVANQIAQHDGSSPKLIFITGNSVALLRKLTSHLSVTAYLQKPFRLKELKRSFEDI